jgi:cobalt-precorrin-5B (C1)-methyltransferase
MTITQIRTSQSKTELRKGFTTGACATAASLAALQHLVGQLSSQVKINLPINQSATFSVIHYGINGMAEGNESATAGVIKDAGDDPDCTHGAEIIATVRPAQIAGINFIAGDGVATVTLPGLELAVGEPAINPVPRKMICQHLLPLLAQFNFAGADVTISVPGGEELAKQTIGQRLGLIGGVSILGTRGTVNPYSTSAYAASVRQSIEVGRQQGLTALYLTTGSRTEAQAMSSAPQCQPISFIQAGDFMGVGLRASVRQKIEHVTVVVMIGKLCKLTCGTMMTHVTGRAIDFSILAQLLDDTEGNQPLKNAVRQANTGRHLLTLLPPIKHPQFYQALCAKAAYNCAVYAHHKLALTVRLINFDGTVLAQAHQGDC